MNSYIVLLTSLESTIESSDHDYVAREKAESFFREYLRPSGYDYVKEAYEDDLEIPVTPFDTAAGKELVDNRLQQTRDSRRRKIESICEELESNDIEALVADQDFEYLCRHLHGMTNSRSNVLFDGTSWARGEMIASEESLEEVINHAEKHDMKLYAVEMNCSF